MFKVLGEVLMEHRAGERGFWTIIRFERDGMEMFPLFGLLEVIHDRA